MRESWGTKTENKERKKTHFYFLRVGRGFKEGSIGLSYFFLFSFVCFYSLEFLNPPF